MLKKSAASVKKFCEVMSNNRSDTPKLIIFIQRCSKNAKICVYKHCCCSDNYTNTFKSNEISVPLRLIFIKNYQNQAKKIFWRK